MSTRHYTRPCKTCPFRASNVGKVEPRKWFTVKNLLRIWNGVRRGKAPGMLCHRTDVNAADYGMKPAPPGTVAQECAGLLVVVARHAKLIEAACQKGGAPREVWLRYTRVVARPFSRMAFVGGWVPRLALGGVPIVGGEPVPNVDVDEPDVKEPWEVGERSPRPEVFDA